MSMFLHIKCVGVHIALATRMACTYTSPGVRCSPISLLTIGVDRTDHGGVL